MTELLALPGWNTPPRSLDDWIAQLTTQGAEVNVERESASVSWLNISSMGLRAYAMSEGERLEALNFELSGEDPNTVTTFIETAARALGWEVYPDEDEEDEDDAE